ncbi:MAG: hypothetical protein FK733_12840 [Asgard group archaeon]|nr:hypothetical protein [Asgard group archaeon]
MRFTKWHLIALSIISALALSSTISYIVLNKKNQEYELSSTLAEIFIDSDRDFRFYGFKGRGTLSNPYVIENLHFFNLSKTAIYIRDTTKHFVIRNCEFDISEKTSIVFQNVVESYGVITNCIFNTKIGIDISYSADLAILDNSFTNFSYGIQIKESTLLNISSNNFVDSREEYVVLKIRGTCIHSIYSSYTSIENNYCYNTSYGIELYNSNNMLVSNNNCTENKKGIIGERVPYSSFINNNCNSSDTSMDLLEAKGVTIRDNNFGKRGIKLYEQHREKFLDYTVENNLANNKEIGFFVNVQNQTIDEEQYGQVFIASCFNLTLSNQNLYYVANGISVFFSENISIINNTCIENKQYGIYSVFTLWSLFANNTCSNAVMGFFITFNMNSTFANNTLHSNVEGFHLYNTTWCLFTRNNLSFNQNQGLLTDRFCENLTITYNYFIENQNYAIEFIHWERPAHGNYVHHNAFINNAPQFDSQCSDIDYWGEWTQDYWYDRLTSEGNYWSDLGGYSYYVIYPGRYIDPYPLSSPDIWS